MENLIKEFPQQLENALKIGQVALLKRGSFNPKQVLITGLGGSGIGGAITAQWVARECKVPVITNNDYGIPGWVSSDTLVIVSSYSGNTEETLSAMQAAILKGAEIACISSGGRISELAIAKGLNLITIPGGQPPRSQLGLSLVLQQRILNHYGLIGLGYKSAIEMAVQTLKREQSTIRLEAELLASKLAGRTTVVYASGYQQGVAVRWCQQLNENSKMLCWHQIVPEMNHNELVGWEGGNENFAAIFLENELDNPKVTKRMRISKDLIRKKTKTVLTVHSTGDGHLGQALYLIHLGDWLSLHLAHANKVSPMTIDAIDHLKSELAKG